MVVPLFVMRYHIFKESPNRSLLIADSQAKSLEFSNINILSLPGAKIEDIYRFVPHRGQYHKIVLFAGGNDLYNGYLPSSNSVDEVANRIINLANHLLTVCERVFVLGVPARYPPAPKRELIEDHELIRHLAVNRRIEKHAIKVGRQNYWVFRGLSDQIYCESHVTERDHVHLSGPALSGLRTILKNRVLYEDYSERISWLTVKQYECSRATGCICGSFTGY